MAGGRSRLAIVLLVLGFAVGGLSQHPASPAAGRSGRWVLDRVDPAVDDRASGVTHRPGVINKTTPAPAAAFSATYRFVTTNSTSPPTQLEPGSTVAIAVDVSGRLDSQDVRGEVGIDVIQLVDDRWTNVSVGAFAGCQPDPFPVGPLKCRTPVPDQATFRYSAPSSGSTFAIGVGVLNARAGISWRYRYETTPSDSASTTPQRSSTTRPSTISTTTTTTTPPVALPLPPVVLLPGVAGSALVTRSGFGSELTWPITTSTNRVEMEIDEHGRPLGEVAAGGVLTGPLVPGRNPRALDFYGGMIRYLRDAHGYVEFTNLFPFPYDWRWSNDVHFAALERVVDDAIARSGRKKVVLLAHSMGGIIARNFVLSDARRAAKVEAVITMGTPFWGAPKVFYALVEGYTFGNPTVEQTTMKALVQNFPAAYQLLPHEPFVWDDRRADDLPLEDTFDVEYERIVAETGKVSGLQQPNDRLLDMARRFHRIGGTRSSPTAMPAGVDLYTIMGVGVRTLDEFGLRTRRGDEEAILLHDDPVVFEPLFGDGDGTVPLANLEMPNANERYYVAWGADDPTAHGDLARSARVQGIVGKILQGAPPSGSEHPYTFVRSSDRNDPDPGVDFTLHSDAHLRIATSDGTLGVGDDGAVLETLPGSFLELNGIEYAALPASYDAVLDVTVTGIRPGSFDLDVRRVRSDGMDSFAYESVPVREGVTATVRLGPDSFASPPALTVTDGEHITTVQATTAPTRDGGSGRNVGVVVALAGLILVAAAAIGVGAMAAFRTSRKK